MKMLKTIVALSLVSLAATAQADYRGGKGHTDWAKVTRVTPQYERVNNPRRECHVEYVPDHRRVHSHNDGRSLGGAVIGGIAGGIVGNQVGQGNGKVAATAVGAAVGAIVGDRIDNAGYHAVRHQTYQRPVERCRVVDHWERRLTGYHVEYEYRGHRYTRFMTEHPGRRVPVQVSVRPGWWH